MQAVEGAVIACAGLGSRLGMGLPKCLIEVDGRTILSRLIEALESRVSRIHVVIGYREEMVAEYCARHHRDVILIRNPRFRETNTAYSISLGSAGFLSKVLYLDGDLIIDELSLAGFVEKAASVRTLVGVTQAKSENAVFAEISSRMQGEMEISAFGRGLDSSYEWANVFSGPPLRLEEASGYVYQALESQLPLPAWLLDLHEVDTPGDLLAAEEFMSERARRE
ncbi:sugar nucleotidyltransferase [Stenotrophomonas sp. ATCM1_4]|uniref:NTP transferase domain-containing protein n=1 Tax=unclassified Stenotrophomonas TaxID=196198 RepID=UPI0010522DCD|nr:MULTISPECIES: NTP transferase domain-containing protein [unclassified Stenotrophomonas]TDB28931.1 sugar nucleotidyltransferase [Stenotrophomonas sp. ATCM1_4]